jgi:peptide-methionine (S)-S-oxide reductase
MFRKGTMMRRHKLPFAAFVITLAMIVLAANWLPSTQGIAMQNGDIMIDQTNLKQAMFGAGCFWGVQAAFDQLDGVVKTRVGYSGGHVENPEYREVCSDATGHAEVVHIYFDPDKVSYAKLVDLFFDEHDPTQHNRQGPDVGSQYRSAIFYYDDEQKEEAQAAISKLASSGNYRKPIVTQVEIAQTFWNAEEYHQKYLEKRGLVQCHVK